MFIPVVSHSEEITSSPVFVLLPCAKVKYQSTGIFSEKTVIIVNNKLIDVSSLYRASEEEEYSKYDPRYNKICRLEFRNSSTEYVVGTIEEISEKIMLAVKATK